MGGRPRRRFLAPAGGWPWPLDSEATSDDTVESWTTDKLWTSWAWVSCVQLRPVDEKDDVTNGVLDSAMHNVYNAANHRQLRNISHRLFRVATQ